MSKFIVIRYPSLPEDEGRTEFLKVCDSKKEANSFIDEYIKDGYFTRGNLDVKVLEETQNKWEFVDGKSDFDRNVEEVTERMRITNGWIYKTVYYQQIVGTFSISMVFVPEIDRTS
jgi:hypothetical protein